MSYEQLKSMVLEEIKIKCSNDMLFQIEFKFECMEYSNIFKGDEIGFGATKIRNKNSSLKMSVFHVASY